MSQNRASTRQRVYAQGYHRAIDRLLTSKIRSVRCINRDESSEDGVRAMIVEDSTRTAVVFLRCIILLRFLFAARGQQNKMVKDSDSWPTRLARLVGKAD